MYKHLMVFAFCLALLSSSVGAETRHAIVIGNDSYPGNALQNARNDATGVYDALRSAGYLSTLLLDVDKATLSRKVDDFVETLHPGDTALLYYAGHGLQVDGENFLVPVDFHLTSPDAVKTEGYSLSSVLERFTAHGATTQVVVLDACRDNPFLGSRSMKGGWAGLGTSAGAFLAFGTSPGSTASDAPGEGHGLFTKSLLAYLVSSDLDIEDMFRKVRESVIRDSGGKQVPWVSSSLIGSFHIRPELDSKQPLIGGFPDQAGAAPDMEGRSLRQEDQHMFNARAVLVGSPIADAETRLALSRAVTLARGAKLQAAMGVLTDILSVNPGCAVALRLLGLLLHATGRDLEATSVLDRALLADSTDARAATYKCAIEGLSEVANAEADCNDVLRTQPSSDGFLTSAGTALTKGDDQHAYEDITRSISLGGSDLSYALRGVIATRQGHKDLAERDYSRAIRLATEIPAR